MERKLIFVYNADSGLMGDLSGNLHRDSHPCHLYKVTHGLFGMEGGWRRFVGKLDLPVEFLHKDEFGNRHPKTFIRNYPRSIAYPCAVIRTPDAVRLLITSEEIGGAHSLEELEDLVTNKILATKASPK